MSVMDRNTPNRDTIVVKPSPVHPLLKGPPRELKWLVSEAPAPGIYKDKVEIEKEKTLQKLAKQSSILDESRSKPLGRYHYVRHASDLEYRSPQDIENEQVVIRWSELRKREEEARRRTAGSGRDGWLWN